MAVEVGDLSDDDFLLLLNAHYESIEFRLPDDRAWRAVVDTARKLTPDDAADEQHERYVISGRSLALLVRESR